MPSRSSTIVTTTTENFSEPARRTWRHSLAAVDKDILSGDSQNRLEMEFRPNLLSLRRRHFTPEPSLALVPASRHVVDHRRYSTAGNLDIYRPKSQRVVYIYEKPVFDNSTTYIGSGRAVAASPIIYWRSPEEYQKVGPTNNGTRLHSSHVTYLPLTSRSTYSPLPSSTYLTSVEKQYYPRATTPLGVTNLGRKSLDSQYEVDQYDNLLKKTFGNGTYPYSSYYRPYYSPSSSYSSRYYNDRPYYSDSYSYPYYYMHPYYSSYYSNYPSYNKDYYGYRDLGYYGSAYYPSRYTYSYTI